jgi:hypothetical protein
MPRFILQRQKELLVSEPTDPHKHKATPGMTPASDDLPADLRSDSRVKIIDELPRLLLIDAPEEVAAEWLARLPGWKLQREQRAKIPDPRPKLKKPSEE